MTALAANRSAMPYPREFKTLDGLVAANVHIYFNALIVCDAGYWRPCDGSEAGLEGRFALALEEVDNTGGGAGDKGIKVEFLRLVRCFLAKNDTVSPIAQANIGGEAYVVDDQTVSADDDSASRGSLGIPWMFYERNMSTTNTSVWVEVR